MNRTYPGHKVCHSPVAPACTPRCASVCAPFCACAAEPFELQLGSQVMGAVGCGDTPERRSE